MTRGFSSESSLHVRIARILGPPRPDRVIVGIGDDAAVLAPLAGRPVLCSDACVEGVHFRLETHSFADLAWKSIGPCLSDVAAMGGRPAAVAISIALPLNRIDSIEFVDAFYGEALAMAQRWEFDVAGGDLTASPGPLFIDVAALGHSSVPTLRSGAKPGDHIAITGRLGGAAAGLEALRRGEGSRPLSERTALEPILDRQRRPRPRFEAADDLSWASAAIDVSDGFALDLGRLCLASGVGALVREADLPLEPGALAYADEIAGDPAGASSERAPDLMRRWAFEGGEDYELLACFAPGSWREAERDSPGFSSRWTLVGSIQANEGLWLEPRNGPRRELEANGFDHFTARSKS